MPRPSQSNNSPSLDALRLSTNEVEAINDDLDHLAEQFQGNNRRQDDRYRYRSTAKIVVTVFHPGGTTTRYLIKPRNISRTGIGFLHGGFLHMGTQLIVSLETLRRTVTNITGKIVHCKFVRGNVHEIGVRFTEPIELTQFVLENQGGDPAADLPRLTGRVLLIEREESDQELLNLIFERLGVQASFSAGTSEALEQLNKGAAFDVAIVDLDSETDPRAALDKLRAAAGETPVIATTAEDQHPLSKHLNGELCHGILVKPLDVQAVAMALLQHLPLASTPVKSEGAAPIYSTLWADTSMRPLVLNYLSKLTQQVEQLRTSLDGGTDAKEATRLCLAIKGTAGSYGFPQISEAAQALRQLINDGRPATGQLDQLDQLCAAAALVRDKAA